jgi:predicted RNase H-like nuclease (RuvC/YqgF family)
MNKKTAIAILIVACVGLAVALVFLYSQSKKEQAGATSTILQFSNQLDEVNVNLNDVRQVNLALNSDLATNRVLASDLSNQLDQTSQQLAGAQSSLQTAQGQITNLDQHISDLEVQNQVLDQRANDLSNTISQLSTQITDTQMKLAVTQTNNEYLESELKKQVAEKDELQHKFNDLNDVRMQVKKLKTDALVARRLEWIREGVDPNKQPKGGQVLMDHTPAATNAPAIRPNFDLNVEVGADGTVHVLTNVPPLITNPPAQ